MVKPDPNDIVDSLTDDQLDHLNQRLDDRRREIAEQPAFCPACGGIGIEWRPGYANSSDLSLCRYCSGQGWVARGRARNDNQADWDSGKALRDAIENVARHEILEIKSSGQVWRLSNKQWSGQVQQRRGLASFRLQDADNAFDLIGTGRLWIAIHYACRGIGDLVIKERIGIQVAS